MGLASSSILERDGADARDPLAGWLQRAGVPAKNGKLRAPGGNLRAPQAPVSSPVSFPPSTAAARRLAPVSFSWRRGKLYTGGNSAGETLSGGNHTVYSVVLPLRGKLSPGGNHTAPTPGSLSGGNSLRAGGEILIYL